MGDLERYRGVIFLDPWKKTSPPVIGSFIPTILKDTQNGPHEQIWSPELIAARESIYVKPYAWTCQGVLHYFDGLGTERVVSDPGQVLEQEILQVLAAHGAGEVLELASLYQFGFSDQQMKLILDPPEDWVLQSTR